MIALPKRILCLDWDRRALRMVVARERGGGMALEDAHSHRIPSAVDIEDAKAMGEFLAQMLRRHRWGHKRVIVDVPREKAVINTLTLPPTPPEELAAAVRFQALKELPFPVDDAVIDFAVIGRSTENKNLVNEVLLAAVRLDTLERLRETCQAAGLTPARIGLRPYANVVSVLRAHNAAERRVLFVDVGPALTEIDVIRGGMLAFSRSANVTVPYGHGDVEEGEDSRVSAKAEAEDAAVSDEAIDEAEKSLVVEITRTLQAYRATDPNAVIDEIIIGGGTGIEPQLSAAVGRRFGLRTELFDPTGALGVSREEGAKLRSFSALLGLAWGLSRQGELEVDFLNPKKPIPRGQSLRRRLRTAGIAAAGLLAIGATWGGMKYRELRSELDSVNANVTQQSKRLRGLIQAHNAFEEVSDTTAGGVFLDDLLALTNQALEPGKKMRVTRTQFARGTANVSMKLLCSDATVANEFARQLNELDGGQRYRVQQKAWAPRKVLEDDPFHGSVDVTVELLDLDRHFASLKDKRKQRDAKLKGF